jgi:hypothetical protein
MNKNEALSKIQDQLKKLMAFNFSKEVKFDNIKLKDGSEICVAEGTDLEVGVDVYKLDDKGVQSPLDDGSYELEDGRVLVVTGSKVESIGEANPDAPATEETPSEDANVNAEKEKMELPTGGEEKPAEKVESPDDEAALGDRLSQLESQVAQILEILQGMGSMQEQAMSKIVELSNEPAEQSFKSNYSKKNVDGDMTALKEIRKTLKSNTNKSLDSSNDDIAALRNTLKKMKDGNDFSSTFKAKN